MELWHILTLMMPIIIPVAAGYLFTRYKIFKPEFGEALLKYLLYATFPAVILANLTEDRFSHLFQFNFSVATIFFVLFMYVTTFVLFKFFFKRPNSETAMAALCAAFTSSGVVGLPIMLDIIGPTYTLIPVIMNTIITLVIAVPITVLFIQIEKHKKGESIYSTLGKTFVDIVKNPLVLASFIGLTVAFFGIYIPAWLHEAFTKIGDASFATALFAVGIGINFATLKKNLNPILFLFFLRVVVFAAVGFGFAILFKIPPGYAVAFVLIGALPVAKSVPAIGQEYGVFTGEAIQVVTLTTIAMIVVIPIVATIASTIWPGIIR